MLEMEIPITSMEDKPIRNVNVQLNCTYLPVRGMHSLQCETDLLARKLPSK